MLLRPSEDPDQDLVFLNMADSGDSLPSHPTHTVDEHDDVFGSAPSSPSHVPARPHTSTTHPSDIPRLQAAHNTNGYREGLTLAKAQSIQSGFDEGFYLGAAIGQTAGQLVGLLEGIANALAASDEPGHAAALRAAKELLEKARAELSATSLFGAEYWETDGTWKFEVSREETRHECEKGAGPTLPTQAEDDATGKQAQAGNEGTAAGADGEGDGIVFEDVARSHPLIRKWAPIVEHQVATWGIKRYSNVATDRDDASAKDERGPKSKVVARSSRTDSEATEKDGGPAKVQMKQWADW